MHKRRHNGIRSADHTSTTIWSYPTPKVRVHTIPLRRWQPSLLRLGTSCNSRSPHQERYLATRNRSPNRKAPHPSLLRNQRTLLVQPALEISQSRTQPVSLRNRLRTGKSMGLLLRSERRRIITTRLHQPENWRSSHRRSGATRRRKRSHRIILSSRQRKPPRTRRSVSGAVPQASSRSQMDPSTQVRPREQAGRLREADGHHHLRGPGRGERPHRQRDLQPV